MYRGDGLNLYTYVQNNPIKYVDPSGYSGECLKNVFDGDKLKLSDKARELYRQGKYKEAWMFIMKTWLEKLLVVRV